MSDVLTAREAYRLWADSYEVETAVSALENRGVLGLTPPVAGRALLDAGCGTGRRLREVRGAARAVGVDLVPAMLAAGGAPSGPPAARVAGDARTLPFRDGCFDVLWCRLVLGHLREPERAYRELARVACPDARLVVSDFHPAAARAGHVRSFRDGEGRLRLVEHHVHDESRHRLAAGLAGWRVETVCDLRPGLEERPFYEAAGRLEDWERHRGLPLVLALLLAR